MNFAQPHPRFDRAEEDVGNIVELGHVNTRVPDQQLATLFYVAGLGLTRDPYHMVGLDNMWVNAGASQFHLPTGAPQVLRGVTGLVIPDLHRLAARLESVRPRLEGTSFSVSLDGEAIEVTSPWGNRIRCHAPDERRFGPVSLGMPYVEVEVMPGTAAGIARFYREIIGVAAAEEPGSATVPMGIHQRVIYREIPEPPPAYDGHHIQITLADFSGPHARLRERGLISEESNQSQYRFEAIIDPGSGMELARIEHEVRSMRHSMYGRALVNRPL